MIGSSKNCSCKEADALANARLLGMLEEFQGGRYTCCQLAQWAQEQRAAWLQAMSEDFKRADKSDADEKGVPVPVRRRRKNADSAQS